MSWADWLAAGSNVVTAVGAGWLATMYWRDGQRIGFPRSRTMACLFAGLGALALLQAGLYFAKALHPSC